jgi:hypothetical protein
MFIPYLSCYDTNEMNTIVTVLIGAAPLLERSTPAEPEERVAYEPSVLR